jgi:hypothetical protein
VKYVAFYIYFFGFETHIFTSVVEQWNAQLAMNVGEIIGGSGHRLVSTNASAADLENIARQVGSAESPWAWGRGA